MLGLVARRHHVRVAWNFTQDGTMNSITTPTPQRPGKCRDLSGGKMGHGDCAVDVLQIFQQETFKILQEFELKRLARFRSQCSGLALKNNSLEVCALWRLHLWFRGMGKWLHVRQAVWYVW